MEIKDLISSNNSKLLSPIDSFAEMHILESNHYFIFLKNDIVGYCSIHSNKTITQFYIEQEYKKYSQDAFTVAKKAEFVSDALIPTCDEFFLSHGMDNFSRISKQAYFFQYVNKLIFNYSINVSYKLAEITDLELIKEKSEDFFDDTLDKQIVDGEIYIGFDNKEVVAFGIFEKGRILKNHVSIGMYTVPEYRQKGVGKQTLSFLIEEGLKNELEPIAGCWYYNHLSKKTLESVGMISNTRYLRIYF